MEAAGFISFSAFAACLLILTSNADATTAASSKSSALKIYKSFLKTSCNTTTYPSLCYKGLSSYASTIKTDSVKLCNTALTLNLRAAGKTSDLVAGMTRKGGLTRAERDVIGECGEEIADTIDELKQASNATANLGGTATEKEERIGDIRTWVSAAMTDEDTCMDAFEEVKVRSSVKDKISKSLMELGKITSNSLALVTSLRY